MSEKVSDTIINLTTKLMMINTRNEALKLSAEFSEAARRVVELEQNNEGAVLHTKSATTSLKFTKKEISKMAETFKKEFIANGLAAKIIKRESGRNSFCYEIRYRSNGYNITASSTDLSRAKEKFLFKTTPKEIGKYRTATYNSNDNTLEAIFKEWYQYKKGTVTDKELRRFETNFLSLPIELQQKALADVRTIDIDGVMKDVKPRKHEELRTLFNGIFKYAIASGIIQHNPVALIKFKRSERQTREALSEDEVKAFLERIKAVKYDSIRQFAYVLYFFGLRPCEIDEETHREGEFLIARNRKRKNGKIEYKKIPIPTQAQGLIDWDKPLTTDLHRLKINDTMKELLAEKTAYCLRHTFATVCQQYVRPDIVDIWMGDSPQRLVGKVYTHFSDEFMRKQMDKVEFPLSA
ncbi:MAG: hypothetical protein E7364_07130 [Clostridiales bacterium]|nr:hypothetical protein [Clostridiales bacterium]